MEKVNVYNDLCKHTSFSKNGIDYFGEFHVEYDHKKTMAGLGVLKRHKTNMIEMHEECIMNAVSGATVQADPAGNSIILGFSKDSTPLGPQAIVTKNEVCCIKCVNETLGILGYVIYIYPNGTYDIYLYDNKGNFTGKGVTFYEDGLIFTKSKKIFFEDESSDFPKKHNTSHLIFNPGDLNIYDFCYSKYHGPLTYRYSGGDLDYIDAAQYQDLYGDLNVTFDKQNRIYVSRTVQGYGYRHTDKGFTLGYIDEYKEFNMNALPFQGVCIRKFDDGSYYVGNFSKGKYNGMALSRKNNNYSFGTYKDGIKNGLFFEVNDEDLYIKKYQNGNIVGKQIRLFSGTLFVEVLDEKNKKIDSFSYPHDIEEGYVVEENSNKDMDAIRDQIDDYTLEELKDYTFHDGVAHKEEDFGYSTRQAPVHIISITGVKNPQKEMLIPSCVYYVEKGAFDSPGCEIIERIRYKARKDSSIHPKSFGPLPGLKEFRIINKVFEIKKDAFYCESLEYIDLSLCKGYIRAGAFTNCKKLKKAIVNYYTKIEKGAFPPGCTIVYKGAYQLDNVKQFCKNLSNIFSSKRRKSTKDLKKSWKQKEKELEEKKKKKLEKKSKTKKAKNKTSFNLGKVGKSILSVLAFPFILIGKFFAMLGKGICNFIKGFFGLFSEIDFGAILESPMTWIPSIILIICAIINITGLHGAIDDLLSNGLSSYSSLFGLHLSGLGAEWLDNLDKSNILVIITGLILVVLVLIFFVLDLVINVLLVAGLILYFLFYLIFGIAYVFVLPLVLLILFIIGFLQDRDNGANLVLLALDIIFAIIFYIPFF